MRGWRLTVVIGGAIAVVAILVSATAPDPVEGARRAIRLTARTSLLLFLTTFTASTLARLLPSAPASWLRDNRRHLGLAFAGSHLVHLIAFVALARLDPGLFDRLTNVVTFAGGGLAYACIAMMALTSTDAAVRAIGPTAWRRLHLIGSWYIWLSFALNFGKRIPVDSLYLLPTLAIVLAGALRLGARRRRAETMNP